MFSCSDKIYTESYSFICSQVISTPNIDFEFLNFLNCVILWKKIKFHVLEMCKYFIYKRIILDLRKVKNYI